MIKPFNPGNREFLGGNFEFSGLGPLASFVAAVFFIKELLSCSLSILESSVLFLSIWDL